MMTSITQSNSITLATLRKLVNVRVDATIQSITIRGPKSHRETAKLFLQETQQQKQDAKAAETSALPPRKSHQRTKSTPAAPPLSLTLGISIPTQFHARLIGRGGARCREIQQESGAVVCFPGSSTYRAAAAPCNEDELENVHASTIIKVSGTRGACETALGILKVGWFCS